MVMRKTGPNDASCIVWAKGRCFFHLFRFLLILTIFFSLFRFCSRYKRMGEGWVGQQQQKAGPNDQDMSFGPYVRVFLKFFRVFYC